MLASACGDDEPREPGTELGVCLHEQFCESGLQCVDGICVSPDQLDETEGASDPTQGESPGGTSSAGETSPGESSPGESSPGDSSPGETSPGETSAGDTSSDPTVYCTTGDANGCFCGHTADYGPPDAACSEDTVGSPAKCCANEGWPAYNGCTCWALSCRILTFGTCNCSIGLPDGDDEPVSSCSSELGVCCLDHDGFACSCWEDLSVCPEDSSPVSSCTTESLHCGDSTRVSACN